MLLEYCVSTDLDIPFRVKILELQGPRENHPFSQVLEHPELAFETGASDYVVSVQLYADSNPLCVPFVSAYKSFSSGTVLKWNQWIELPVKYCELPFNSLLAITLWKYSPKTAVVPFAGTTISLFDPEDGSLKRGRQRLKLWLGRKADGLDATSTPSDVKHVNEMDRLEMVIKQREADEIPQVAWLDNLAFRQIEKINQINQLLPHEVEHVLYVDFVQFDSPVVFAEAEYCPPPISKHAEKYIDRFSDHPQRRQRLEKGVIYDPDMFRDNPVELKYRHMNRAHKLTTFDKEIRPNPKIRDEIAVILEYPPMQELSDADKDLMWKFRYYLTRNKKALTKFLNSVSWNDANEARHAVELLPQWAEIDVDDALELLGPKFTNSAVRSYAVDRLKKASDREVELYMMQLVEALKFENSNEPMKRNDSKKKGSGHGQGNTTSGRSSIAKFLIQRSIADPVLTNYLYWYLKVEAEGSEGEAIFKPVLNRFLLLLKQAPNGGDKRSDTLKAQIKLMDWLHNVSLAVKGLKEPRDKKLELLKSRLRDPADGILEFSPIPLPLDPTVMVCGCYPDESYVFKSSLSPSQITFKTTNGGKYAMMFKVGDDLRQDQLVIQIITLMDQLLKNENLDLKLTPYRILATSSSDGAMQFVPNETLRNVLNEHHGILPFLRTHSPDAHDPLGVRPDVMDTFIRSCAGYCVITYLLGVGDRHLDNLLITPDGHFFHADFGYILGRDPKPFPPMMKLPIQIIDGMGGVKSENYNRFRSYCFTTYNTLRKSANLILNLFALMLDSQIPDIMIDKEKVIYKVKEKFCLEMSEEEAMQHFQNLINDSVSALLPMVIDRLHSMAQYWRT